jgi:hypothetical protein
MEFEGFAPEPAKILAWAPGPDDNAVIFQMVKAGKTEDEVVAEMADIEPANVRIAYKGFLERLTTPEAAEEAKAAAAALEAEAKDATAKAAVLKTKAQTIAEKVAAKAKDAPPADPLG